MLRIHSGMGGVSFATKHQRHGRKRAAGISRSSAVAPVAADVDSAKQELAAIESEIEALKTEPPTDHEVQRAINQIESSFFDRMERVGGFGGCCGGTDAAAHGRLGRLRRRLDAARRIGQSGAVDERPDAVCGAGAAVAAAHARSPFRRLNSLEPAQMGLGVAARLGADQGVSLTAAAVTRP